MLRKIPRILLFVGLMVAIWLLVSCSTKKPWQPTSTNPIQAPLQLIIQAGPDTATAVPHNSNVTFVWSAFGGNTQVRGYEWYLEPLEDSYGDLAATNTVTYLNLAGADDGLAYTFHLRVTDGADTVTQTRDFVVTDTLPPPPADSIPPTVMITESPISGSFAATGSIVKFGWQGDDGHGYFDELTYQFIFTATNDTSEWISAVTAVFANVPTSDPATFWVRAQDSSGNISEWDTLSFIIKPASILYVDDYLWLDAMNHPDVLKELEQKQFYRDALDGYAFAERDIARQGIPDSADLVDDGTPVYSSIIFCSDSYVGTEDGTWYNNPNLQNVMRYYLSNGGHLLISGAFPLIDMNYDPQNGPTVVAGDFQFDWLGIDSVAWCYDYWPEMTYVLKDPATTYDLPDSMKIDVAKNGDQLDYATSIYNLQSNSEPIFIWGLTIDATTSPPSYFEGDAFGVPVGYVTSINDEVTTALLGFDTFSMPKPDITRIFRTILTAFGE